MNLKHSSYYLNMFTGWMVQVPLHQLVALGLALEEKATVIS